MLTVKYISENKEKIVKGLAKRHFDAKELVDSVIELDEKRRSTQNQLDNKLAESKNISKEVGKLFKEGKTDEANAAKAKTVELKEVVKQLGSELEKAEKKLQDALVLLPNVPHEKVRAGKNEEDNELIVSGGDIPELAGDALPHWDLAKKYDIIDFELGTKLTGAGFPVYKGKGAKLQRALINFFLDEAEKAGFDEVMPPIVVNEDSGFGTGQLPDKEGMMYHVDTDDLYLVPTAEVPVTNIYRDVILDAKDFPIKNTAYTPCFRREAGSWGAHVRGLNRLHQFDKVEIVEIAHPDNSYEILEEMVAHVRSLVEKLELPFRIVRLCGGDLGFASAMTYDFEVYAAAQKRWLEVSSVSNFEAFQSNRLKLRFRESGEKKTQLAHTLNGSALAFPRIVAALLENNQTSEGIRLPKALAEYTRFDIID